MVGVYSAVGVYTIGHTPRPDLLDPLQRRFGAVEFRLSGILDGLAEAHIPSGSKAEYPLEARLRSGNRVVVDAAFLAPRLQRAVSRFDEDVRAHLVLCAGPFPGLTSQAPVILPFESGAVELARRRLASLEIVVPFGAQVAPAANKWQASGFGCRVHDMGQKPELLTVAEWLRERLSGTDADALVFDYVGIPPEILDTTSASLNLPVFDLGRLAMDALEHVLR